MIKSNRTQTTALETNGQDDTDWRKTTLDFSQIEPSLRDFAVLGSAGPMFAVSWIAVLPKPDFGWCCSTAFNFNVVEFSRRR